jgi:uncharacterized GH25 family protein
MNLLRWILLSAIATVAWNTLVASDTRPDLKGRVVHDDGSPVPKATVFIYTAGPKEGTSSLCPSCYADCRKQAKTDADGRFTIESLDPALLFRLLIVAPRHQSQFVPKVNPATAEAKVTLKSLDPEALKSPNRITGVVIDQNGKPVAGAVIAPEGVKFGAQTRWGGSDEFVDPVAATDDQGHFLMQCKDVVIAVHAVVEARNAAKRWVELSPGQDHFIRLQEGATVTGQIERDGKPLKDVMVGLVTKDREAGKYFHCDEIATDVSGRFMLFNVPPEREFVWFATMSSMAGQGAVKLKTFTTGKTGTQVDLGKLQVEPAYRISGRVVLTDDKPVPAGTRITLGREDAWDTQESKLAADGHFEIANVPAESVGLSVRVRGYTFSTRNPSRDYSGRITGRVDKDISDLTLLMDPGDRRVEPLGLTDSVVETRDKPLSSAK